MADSASSTVDNKAKRTHARRSCNMCKLRKTRCELPDVNVPASSEALPPSKTCHRCKTLSLNCVVDDKGRKRGLPRDADGELIAPRGPTSRSTLNSLNNNLNSNSDGARLSVGSAGIQEYTGPGDDLTAQLQAADPYGEPSTLWEEESNVRLLHGIQPYPGLGEQDQNGLGGDAAFSPPGKESVQSMQSKSMKLHGRPLELVCAMLGAAYGKTRKKLNIQELVKQDLRSQLEPAVTRLSLYHPHLPALHELFDEYEHTNSADIALLLFVVIYLASISVPNATMKHIRATLTSQIRSLRDEVVLQQIPSIRALQALDLLTFHAPLGVLPWEPVNFRTMEIAKGQSSSALAIRASLNSPLLGFDRGVEIPNSPQTSYQARFEAPETWIWLNLVANEACLALENEVYAYPPALADARHLVSKLVYLNGDLYSWSSALNSESESDIARLIGKLAVIDRISRLGMIHRAVDRLHQSLERLASDPFFPIVGEIEGTLDQYNADSANHESEIDMVLSAISERPIRQKLESGWRTYRRMRKDFEFSKVTITAIRTLIATAFLPGQPLARGDLPTDLSVTRKVEYAKERAAEPAGLLAFMVDDKHPAVPLARDKANGRNHTCQSILVSALELGYLMFTPMMHSQDHPESDAAIPIFPILDTVSIMVESTKILMEMRAGEIMIHRSIELHTRIDMVLQLPAWFPLLRQVSQVWSQISAKYAPIERTGPGHETIPMACSNIATSMVRVTDEWTREIRRETTGANGTNAANGNGLAVQSDGVNQPLIDTADTLQALDSLANPAIDQIYPPMQYPMQSELPSDLQAILPQFNYGQPSQVPHGNGDSQGGPQGQYPVMMQQGQALEQQQVSPPTAMDILLAQMFNYSYAPESQNPSSNQQQNGMPEQNQFNGYQQ